MEKTTRTRPVYKGGMINLRIDTVSLPGGRESCREIIEHPGAAAVVPVLDSGSLVLVKQFRKPVESFLLEIPAGKLDEGETPVDCARRELEEETGYGAGLLKKIFDIFPSPGYSDEVITIFRAEKLAAAAPRPPSEESIGIVETEPAEALRMIRTGSIKDAKTIAGILAVFSSF